VIPVHGSHTVPGMKRWSVIVVVSVLTLALPGMAESRVKALGKSEAREIVSKRLWAIGSNSGKWMNWGVGKCRRDSRIQVRCRAWWIPMNPVLNKRLCNRTYRVRAVSDSRYSMAVWEKRCRPLRA